LLHLYPVLDHRLDMDTSMSVLACSDQPGLTCLISLDQNLYTGSGPITGKVLIVCPVSLFKVSTASPYAVQHHHSDPKVLRPRTGKRLCQLLFP